MFGFVRKWFGYRCYRGLYRLVLTGGSNVVYGPNLWAKTDREAWEQASVVSVGLTSVIECVTGRRIPPIIPKGSEVN